MSATIFEKKSGQIFSQNQNVFDDCKNIFD